MLAASTLSVYANARVAPRLPARSIRGARAASARLPIRATSSTGGQRHVATPRASEAQKADRRGDKLPMRASSDDGYALDNTQVRDRPHAPSRDTTATTTRHDNDPAMCPSPEDPRTHR